MGGGDFSNVFSARAEPKVVGMEWNDQWWDSVKNQKDDMMNLLLF